MRAVEDLDARKMRCILPTKDLCVGSECMAWNTYYTYNPKDLATKHYMALVPTLATTKGSCGLIK
jgi:hypothetical protein